jgi:hypothetical protein
LNNELTLTFTAVWSSRIEQVSVEIPAGREVVMSCNWHTELRKLVDIHSLWKVPLKGGAGTWALDLTGAQFGYYDQPATRWDKYKATRLGWTQSLPFTLKDRDPIGYGKFQLEKSFCLSSDEAKMLLRTNLKHSRSIVPAIELLFEMKDMTTLKIMQLLADEFDIIMMDIAEAVSTSLHMGLEGGKPKEKE